MPFESACWSDVSNLSDNWRLEASVLNLSLINCSCSTTQRLSLSEFYFATHEKGLVFDISFYFSGRTTYGASSGKVCYGATLKEKLECRSYENFGVEKHQFRIGISTEAASIVPGMDDQSVCIDNFGRSNFRESDCQFNELLLDLIINISFLPYRLFWLSDVIYFLSR